ncbi:MAG TPA: FHA domain-containing protein, partial [Tepidiformaceae bacterium]|nr:FHA domain-containing protein [Tepidiformaceae bacterium]
MKFGLLRVTTGDGRTREYPLDLPTLVVGRADGNSIVIDDLSVARRHARLTIDSGRLLVEDLGSAEGTFIGPQRIPANTPSLVENNQVIRFGEVTASYEAPAAVSTDATNKTDEAADVIEGQPYELPATVRASLTMPVLPLEVGGVPGVGTLMVQNRGRVVDELSIEVLDLPSDWVRLSQPKIVLLPNDQTEITLIVQPPRRADSRAGDYEFAVVVTSGETGREVLTNGHLSVLPFEATTLELHPVRSTKQFTLHALNNGNAAATYLLSGTDDEEALLYEFALPQIELAAGEEALIPFRVSPRKRKYLGPTLTAPFTVLATPLAEGGAKATSTGQVSVRPVLQPFVRPALLTLILAAFAVGLFWYFFSTSSNGVTAANAEAPYAGVHMCDKDKTKTAKPEPASAAAPLFEQNDPQWGKDVYAKANDTTFGPDWCGTIMDQCGAAITSLATAMNLFQLTVMPDGSDLTPKSLNTWANLQSTKGSKGWVSQGYVNGDVVWTLVNQLSEEIAKAHPGARVIRFAGIGTGSDAEVRSELKAGRPVILQIPGHWITAVGFDGDKILINDPYYRDRKTLDFYAGKVESSVL